MGTLSLPWIKLLIPLAAVGNPRRTGNEDCDPGNSAPAKAAVVILSREGVCAECAIFLTEASTIPGSCDVLTSEGSWQKFLTHARQSRPMAPAWMFLSQRKGRHSTGIYWNTQVLFVRRWFCVVFCPKPPLHRHNWLSFGKFQDTEFFLSPLFVMFRHIWP
jgi:hypothetical protein